VDWEGFDWDEGNSGKNLSHGVTDEEIEEVFLKENQPAAVRHLGSQRGEPRYRALVGRMRGAINSSPSQCAAVKAFGSFGRLALGQ
jgi:hypothetical protein